MGDKNIRTIIEKYPPNVHFTVKLLESSVIRPNNQKLSNPSLINYRDVRLYIFGGLLGRDNFQNVMRYYEITSNKWFEPNE